ncbi:MAG: hypothetical protein WD738_10710 [Pirellulales bacterium]
MLVKNLVLWLMVVVAIFLGLVAIFFFGMGGQTSENVAETSRIANCVAGLACLFSSMTLLVFSAVMLRRPGP